MKDKRKSNDKIISSQFKEEETILRDGVFTFTGPMTIGDFAHKTNLPANNVISYFFKQGKMFNINHILDEEQIAELCLENGFDFEKELEINAQNFTEHIDIVDEDKDLESRPPIITIMGHVDHGKTTLIDFLRNSRIASGEAGGITQHTGAYQIKVNDDKITVLDTPGHAAFTEMRARGAKVTDIVILVVAADDGVKPQTKEAIDHAKASNVPIIVFINKMDKQDADPEKVIGDLSQNDIVVEQWGGDVQAIKGSALTGQGVDELLKAINLQAQMLELKANPNRQPIGTVVESWVDKGKGAVATIIVQNGTLNHRDFIVAGGNYGRIRTMKNTFGETIDDAGPGTPVVITGLNFAPIAGDKVFGFIDEKFAKQIANKKNQLDREDKLKEHQVFKIEDGMKVFNVLIKSDVHGTSEAIKHSLSKIANDEAVVRVIRSSTGAITKSDLLLAQASNATIYGFNVRPSSEIKSLAADQKVEIKSFSIIYKMIEDVEAILNGMQETKYEEEVTGEATIQKIIYFSKVGNIAGCLVNSGVITSNSLMRLIRDGVVIFEGQLDSLQRGKDSAKKVETGKDFGTHIKNYNDIKVGDVIECYRMKEVE